MPLKKLILITIPYFLLLSCYRSNDFSIIIKESGMLNESKYIISQNSINIEAITFNPELVKTKTEIPINKIDGDSLFQTLNKIMEDDLKLNYTNTDIDCNYEFDFKFIIANKVQTTTISGYKHIGILKLVRKINSLIPDKNIIHYTEENLELIK